MERVKGRRTSVFDTVRSGRAYTVTFVEVKEDINQRIRNNWRIRID